MIANPLSIVAICVGASVGAVARWLLSLWLNEPLATIPLGTLAANLIGGLLVGLAVGYFSLKPDLSPEWRLLIVTGFLGGLTTFSTFSAEVTSLLQQGRLAWAAGIIGLHVAGSIAMTLLGLAAVHLLMRQAT